MGYDAVTVNAFSEQFSNYKKLNYNDISNPVLQNACYYYDEKTKYYRGDILEAYICETKDSIRKYQFDLLFKVEKLVLVLPHFNASEKRVFSMLKKNKILFIEIMGFKTSGSVLTEKLADQNATKLKHY